MISQYVGRSGKRTGTSKASYDLKSIILQIRTFEMKAITTKQLADKTRREATELWQLTVSLFSRHCSIGLRQRVILPSTGKRWELGQIKQRRRAVTTINQTITISAEHGLQAINRILRTIRSTLSHSHVADGIGIPENKTEIVHV